MLGKSWKRWGSLLLLMVTAAVSMGQIPDPTVQRRSTTYWEITKFREQIWDDVFIQRDANGNFIGAIIGDNATNDEIMAIVESTKVNQGSEIGFLRGVHVLDSTIWFGPNTRFYGVTGGKWASGYRQRPVIRWGADSSGATNGTSMFAADREYFNTDGTLSYDGNAVQGYVDNVVIEGLRIDVGIHTNYFGQEGHMWDVEPEAAIDFRGVTSSRVSDCEILNWTWGIIAGANECDTLFYQSDSTWTTKGWHNTFENNSFTNTYYTGNLGYGTPAEADSVWNDDTSDFRVWRDAVGPAAMLLVNANSAIIRNNSFATIGGPKLWIPHQDVATVEQNNFETSSSRDTLQPHVLIGYWADGDTSYAPYDSTHRFVNREAADCAEIYWTEGGGAQDRGLRFLTGRQISVRDNRFELDDTDYKPSIWWGPGTTGEVIGNGLGKGTQSPPTRSALSVVQNYGQDVLIQGNFIATDGPTADETTAWRKGDKSFWHAVNSNPNGGKVYLDAGVYNIDMSDDGTGTDEWHSIPSNTHVIGVPGQTILRLSDLATQDTMAVFRGMINIEPGDSNIVLEGITFDGNYAAQCSTGATPDTIEINYNKHIALGIGHRSSALNNKNITIKNCVFRDWARAILIQADNNKGSVKENIRIIDNEFIPAVQLSKTTGDPVDPDNISVTAWEIDVAAPDTLKGLVIARNRIEDNGIRQLLSFNGGNKYDNRIPAIIQIAGDNIINSRIEDNYVDVTTNTDGNGDTNTRVDTLLTDYDYLGYGYGEREYHVNRFYDVGRMKTDTMKVGAHEFGTDGNLPWWPSELISDAGAVRDAQGSPAIAIDSNDNLNVVYVKKVGALDWDLVHREKNLNTGVVSSETVIWDGDSIAVGVEYIDPAAGIQCMVTTNDSLRVFIENAKNVDSTGILHFVEGPAGTWTPDTTGFAVGYLVDTHKLGGRYSANNSADWFNYGTKDSIFIAYTSDNDSVRVVAGETGSWSQSAPYGGLTSAYGSALHIDDSGHIHIAFIARNSGGTENYLIHAESTNKGSTWPANPDTIYTFSSYHTSRHGPVSIASNSNEDIFIAFIDIGDGKLRVANDIGGWSNEEVGIGYFWGLNQGSVSIKIDSSDSVRVAYSFLTDIYNSLTHFVADQNKWMNMATRLGTDSWRIDWRIGNHFGSGSIVDLAYDSKDNWWIAAWEESTLTATVQHPGNNGRNAVALYTNRDAFVEEGMYYYNRDVERIEVYSGTQQDTLATTNRDYQWSTVFHPSSVILTSSSPGDSGGYINNYDMEMPYIFPWDASLVGISCIVSDTTSIFNLELYQNDDLELTPASTDALFSVPIDSTSIDSIGTTSKSYYLKTTSMVEIDATDATWRRSYQFNAGDRIRPFARIATDNYANELRLVLYFRRR